MAAKQRFTATGTVRRCYFDGTGPGCGELFLDGATVDGVSLPDGLLIDFRNAPAGVAILCGCVLTVRDKWVKLGDVVIADYVTQPAAFIRFVDPMGLAAVVSQYNKSHGKG
jgi:hypothetical protein